MIYGFQLHWQLMACGSGMVINEQFCCTRNSREIQVNTSVLGQYQVKTDVVKSIGSSEIRLCITTEINPFCQLRNSQKEEILSATTSHGGGAL